MYNWDTFYNKKRNFPQAEEREYDDIPEVSAVLARPDQYHGGTPCTVRFKPDMRKCILSRTISNLKSNGFPFDVGYIITDQDHSYEVVDFHLNYYPKYIIADVLPSFVDHSFIYNRVYPRG